MSRDYDSIEMEHATAVAAAAFAIISQEKEMIDPREISMTRTKSKVDAKKPPILSHLGSVSKRFSGSFKTTDDQGSYKVPISPATEQKKPEKTFTPAPSMKKALTFSEKFQSTDKKPETSVPKKTPSFSDQHLMNTDDIKPKTPVLKKTPTFSDPYLMDTDDIKPEAETPKPEVPRWSMPPPPPPPIRQTSTPARVPPTGQTLPRPGTSEAKADAWLREELKNIKERYEKLLETIDSWEKRKRMKARRKLNKHEQSDNERKRAKAMRKYQDKMKYIDEIAGGARAQSHERLRNEELRAKEKANKIRTTGKLPGVCSCF
ncbi:pollen-specific leucine-rich repeat extensin-like protein 1 isoform X2 [Lotus japonicus]|nr:pollen-specific leucine-rich repeat extensin-like protein 1 isoform X2 [Lotus japonicus]